MLPRPGCPRPLRALLFAAAAFAALGTRALAQETGISDQVRRIGGAGGRARGSVAPFRHSDPEHGAVLPPPAFLEGRAFSRGEGSGAPRQRAGACTVPTGPREPAGGTGRPPAERARDSSPRHSSRGGPPRPPPPAAFAEGKPPPPAPPPAVAQGKDPPNDQVDEDGSCCALLAAAGWTVDLPAVVVATAGGVPDEPKVPGRACTCGGPAPAYDGAVAIERRGNSSQRQNRKQSYLVELRHADAGPGGAPRADRFPLLGMPRHEEWVLYGPEDDFSFLRNWLAFWVARRTGRWAPRARFVELFLVDDGAGLEGLSLRRHYAGLYLLHESVARGKDRVAVGKLRAAEDLTGGYILKYDNDNFDAGDARVPTAAATGLEFVLAYPRRPPAAAVAYVRGFLEGLEAALFDDAAWRGPGGYRRYLDVGSFVDYFLATEVTKNPDGYRGSTFMHKDRGGPLRMGPVWDYNEAFGVCCGYPIEGYDQGGRSGPGVSGGSAISPEGWRFNICEDPGRCLVEPADGTSQWFRRLWRDPAFRGAAAARWRELRGGALAEPAVAGAIAAAAGEIRAASSRNGLVWGDALRARFAGESFSSWPDRWERAVRELEAWTLQRLRWMDGALAGA